MNITKIKIENFKSIELIEFDISKIGESYTKILVGVNESGKSNILNALSFFNTPTNDFEFLNLCNQKNENAEYIDFYFDLDFENPNYYINRLKNEYEFDKEIKFKIENIKKNIYLKKGSNKFEEEYEFETLLDDESFFFKKITKTIDDNGNNKSVEIIKIEEEENKDDGFKLLTAESFDELFSEKILTLIKECEPKVTFWTPSEDYLLSEFDLNKFKNNQDSNKPLRNIFSLSGYDSVDKIQTSIENITNSQQRSRLVSKLNKALNKYLKNVWDHSIEVIIDITETGLLSLSIRDTGSYNEHDRFSINERSEGAKHFLSLILSLSLESNNNIRSNELILIDEPEQHLHPSGIRDLSKELLNIGKNNFVFIATHSPFLIDKNHKDRHFIIKKNNKAITEIMKIADHMNFIDDEVLREAFGIEVYKDLLNPHSILVEGCSDKVILQKIFHLLKKNNIGITNGHGSNIDTLASKLNHNSISILVVVDDDPDGKKYKEKIIKIGGAYNTNNVLTLRDIVGDLIEGATIEDLLNKDFILSQFKELYKETFEEDILGIEIEDEKPVIEQLINYLKVRKKYSKWDMDLFKKYMSDNFKPTINGLRENSPLLALLAEKIIEKLEK